MHYSKLKDEELVELLKNGNKNAFEEIYNRHWNCNFKIAYHTLGIKEEAEEIVQDIYEQIWNKRTSLNIRSIGPYLAVMTKHKCINFIKSQINFRKFQEYQIFHEILHNHSVDDVIHFSDLAEAVEKVLSNLPEKSCEIFKKSRFENMSVKEIARHYDLTEKAVEYHITKSLKTLKEELKLYHSDN